MASNSEQGPNVLILQLCGWEEAKQLKSSTRQASQAFLPKAWAPEVSLYQGLDVVGLVFR